jgi:anhydro-N-acetylmuramic acid kinase
MRLFIGLMSGTSMDGIDAALVDVGTHTLIAGITLPYSDKAQQFLQAVLIDEAAGPAALSQLNTVLGREFALAVKAVLAKANIPLEEVIAIGSHGQTICHDATAEIPYTVQLGCAHTIAELTGINVVADFRTRDLVIGGQGAPFAPIYHQAVFKTQELPLAVVNIGGIANVTYLTEDGQVSGYDIGPGNCLLDRWIQQHLGHAYDADGKWSATGKVIETLLFSLLDDPYFKLAGPKSLGKEYFSSDWLNRHLSPAFLPEDVQATLLAFTAATIAAAIQQCSLPLKRLVICGGGVHNTILLNTLAKQLPTLSVVSSSELGVDPDFMEAMMFAWLADQTLKHNALDFKGITGAKRVAIFGAIYAAAIDKRNSIEV